MSVFFVGVLSIVLFIKELFHIDYSNGEPSVIERNLGVDTEE